MVFFLTHFLLKKKKKIIWLNNGNYPAFIL